MTLTIIIVALIYHFVFDWYLQSRDEAKAKSTDPHVLLRHGIVIFISTIGLFCAARVSLIEVIFWSAIYALIHVVQDSLIYKNLVIPPGVLVENYKPLWDRIALDQFLHLTVLFSILSILV